MASPAAQGVGAISIVGGIAGAAFGVIRSLPKRIYNGLHRLLVVEIEIREPDMFYYWINKWFYENTRLAKSNRLQLVTNMNYDGYYPDYLSETRDHQLIPGNGKSYFFFNKRPFLVEKFKEDSKQQKVTHYYYLSTFRWWRKHFDEIINAVKIINKETKDELEVFASYDSDGDWNMGVKKRKKSIDSVILNKEIKQNIINDLRNFINSRDQYEQFGINWNRGYMLYGVPGSGKTSLIIALASEMGYDVCLINLSKPGMTDEVLGDLFRKRPKNCFIVIEDIDCSFVGRERHPNNKSEVSFNGLLNCINGIASVEGTILFITTNKIEVMDDALIRTGRIDYQLEFDYATREQMEMIYNRFFPDAKQDDVEKFCLHFKDKQVSMSDVQEEVIALWKSK